MELNLTFNADAGEPSTNVLMDVPRKYSGHFLDQRRRIGKRRCEDLIDDEL